MKSVPVETLVLDEYHEMQRGDEALAHEQQRLPRGWRTRASSYIGRWDYPGAY